MVRVIPVEYKDEGTKVSKMLTIVNRVSPSRKECTHPEV
jgi:hypothetical protein